MLIALIVAAELALILFAVLPQNWKVAAIFLNGLPLGMVWGLFWRTMWCTSLTAIATKVNASTLKTHATGKGGAGKPQVLAEAIRRLDYQGHNHNEADALWLADMGARLHGYDRPALPAAHLKALDRLRPKASA